ncbi:hypothetical protein HDU76_003385 [Blyttiomyces sp. JEL0837]|nr:hypothetical protein HDU76_003385 [Blyttiomyces sp. JEL0837]
MHDSGLHQSMVNSSWEDQSTSKFTRPSPPAVKTPAWHWTSCEKCRLHNRDCDGTRPSCEICLQLKLDCVYPTEPVADVEHVDLTSSFYNPPIQAAQSPTSFWTLPIEPPTASTHQIRRRFMSSSSSSHSSPSTPLIPPFPPTHATGNLNHAALPAFTPSNNEAEIKFLIGELDRFRYQLPLSTFHRRTLLKSFNTFSPLLQLSICGLGAALSARYSNVHKTPTRPVQFYYTLARKAVLEVMDDPSLDNLQALIALYECSLISGTSSDGWLLLGMVTGMASLLELNVDPDTIEKSSGIKMPWLIKETRRRCWHASVALNAMLSPTSSQSALLSSQTLVKPVCSDELWESLADPAQLESQYLNPSPKSGSLINSLNQYLFIFRKAFPKFKTESLVNESQPSFVPYQLDPHETAQILEMQNEIHAAYAAVPGIGRIPIDVKKFTRGAVMYLLESQSLLAMEFKEWVSGAMTPPSSTTSTPLPWLDLLVGREQLLFNSGADLGYSGKPGAVSPSTTSPGEWFFESFHHKAGPHWKAVAVNYSYHHCMMIVHTRRLFDFVKIFSEMNDDDIVTEAILDPTTLSLFDTSFQLCRASAEHVFVITTSILTAGASTGVKNMFAGFRLQTIYQAALVIIMLLVSRSNGGIRFNETPSGLWDSGIDGDAVARYFEWLDVVIDLLEVNMRDASAKALVTGLEDLVRKLKRGETVKDAVLAWARAGVSSDVTVAAAAAVLEESQNEGEVGYGQVVDNVKDSILLERLRDIKQFISALAVVVKRSTAVSVRSASLGGSTESRRTSLDFGPSGAMRAAEDFVGEQMVMDGGAGNNNFLAASNRNVTGVDQRNTEPSRETDFTTVEDLLDIGSMDWAVSPTDGGPST